MLYLYRIDTLPAKAREILPSASQLSRAQSLAAARGCLSRSVAFRRTGTRFRLPGGTVDGQPRERSQQDIERGIPIAVQHEATFRADMRPHGQRLLHPAATPGTILSGEARRYRDNGNAVQATIVPEPGEEEAPTGIADTRGPGGGSSPGRQCASLRRQSHR